MPLDHFSISVPQSKLDGVITFLTTSLKDLGFKEIMRPVSNVVGLGENAPYFWVKGVDTSEIDEKTLDAVLKQTHIAFVAENSAQVKKFHELALNAGGTCNGPPGLRAHYHPGYYGAFVRDPECGINCEVVSHKGEQ